MKTHIQYRHTDLKRERKQVGNIIHIDCSMRTHIVDEDTYIGTNILT